MDGAKDNRWIEPGGDGLQRKPTSMKVSLITDLKGVGCLFLSVNKGVRLVAEIETRIIAALQTVFEHFGWIGVAGLLAFENAFGITPSEIILGLAGWLLLAANETSPAMILIGGLYAAVGSVIGSSVTYWLVRLGGRPVLLRSARWIGLDPQHIQQAEILFKRWGPGLVLFGRLVPGVRTLITIPAGLARMSYPQFLIYTFTGAYVWCTAMIGVGYVFGHEWSVVSEYYKEYIPWFVACLIALFSAMWIGRRLIQRRLRFQQALSEADIEQ